MLQKMWYGNSQGFFSEYKMHRVLIKYVQIYRGNGDDFGLNLKNLDVRFKCNKLLYPYYQ